MDAEDPASLSPGQRRWALAVSVATILLVALPGIRMLVDGAAPDSFPLSTYPMFTRDPGRVVELPTVVHVEPGGTVRRLSPREIAGSDQVIQAAVTVQDAVAGGRRAALALCHEVAARVAGPGRISVVVEEHDVVGWASGERTDPRERRRVADCGAGR